MENKNELRKERGWMTFEMVNARYLNFNTKQKILKLEEAQV